MTKSKEKVDQDVLESIRKSSEKYRQLYPVLVDANDELIDGEHRTRVFKKPETRKLDYVKTKRDRLAVRLVANHARKGQNKETWESSLNELAEILEREGVEKIGMKIAEETGLPYRTLMRYLSGKFKDQAQSMRASAPRLPTDSPLPEETEILTPSAQSLVESPAKTEAEKKIPTVSKGTMLRPTDIFETFDDLGLKDKVKPKIRIQKYSNQPWKAIILPKDFFNKLEAVCERSQLNLEEVLALALLSLYESIRRKGNCLEEEPSVV